MSILQQFNKRFSSTDLKRMSQDSRTWFKQNVKEVKGNVNRQKLLKDSRTTLMTQPIVGSMVMYFYDPKHAKTLPYYDAFPLVIITDVTPDGWYGINLHYLSPIMRAKLLEQLTATLTNKRYDKNTKFKINYNILQSVRKFKAFQPCFKRYLVQHVNSQVRVIHPKDWETCVFLPTEQFRGNPSNKSHIWGRSRKAIK